MPWTSETWIRGACLSSAYEQKPTRAAECIIANTSSPLSRPLGMLHTGCYATYLHSSRADSDVLLHNIIRLLTILKVANYQELRSSCTQSLGERGARNAVFVAMTSINGRPEQRHTPLTRHAVGHCALGRSSPLQVCRHRCESSISRYINGQSHAEVV